MSELQSLETGSRHDLRVGISPDAPDEDKFQDDGKGAFGYCHSYETSSRYDGPGFACRAVRLGVSAAVHVLPQPRYVASQGRNLRFGPAGARSARQALHRRSSRLVEASQYRAANRWFSSRLPSEFLPARRKWACTRPSRHQAFLAIAPTIHYLSVIDLVLLDIKSSNPDTYRKVTGRDLAPTLRFAERLASMGKPAWVRFTLVPGQTDDPANVEGIAKFVAPMKNVEWVEIQPFHQMGSFKWKAMNLEYKCADTPTPTPELVNRVIGAISRGRLPRPVIWFYVDQHQLI